MNNQTLVIKAYGPWLDTVVTDKVVVTFRPAHITYTQLGSGARHDGNSFSFDVEEKLYTDSGHSSKITFTASASWEKVDDGAGGSDYKLVREKKKEEAERQRILNFVETLMAGVKAESRFSLKEHINTASA